MSLKECEININLPDKFTPYREFIRTLAQLIVFRFIYHITRTGRLLVSADYELFYMKHIFCIRTAKFAIDIPVRIINNLIGDILVIKIWVIRDRGFAMDAIVYSCPDINLLNANIGIHSKSSLQNSKLSKNYELLKDIGQLFSDIANEVEFEPKSVISKFVYPIHN